MIYIFVYNVISIKSDFSRLKSLCKAEKFILIASNYCLQHLSTKNRPCFDAIHPIARNFHNVDYDNIKQIVETYVQKHGAENLRIMTNEDSTQISCAKVREHYKIPGDLLDDVLPFVNKAISKKRLEHVVNIPKFVLFDKLRYAEEKEDYLKELVEKLGFPMFAKPIDMVSSIGTHKINDFMNLKNAADSMLIDIYQFEVDEFIDGDLFHCDLVLDNGELKFFTIGEYAFPLADFSKGFPMGSIPVTDKSTHNDLYTLTNQVIQKFGFKKGGIHLEIFLEKRSKKFIFLEIAARTPGAMLPRSYEIQFGINIEEWHYLAHMDLLSNFEPAVANKFGGWISFPTISGIVIDIKKPKIKIQHEPIEYVSIGQLMQNPSSLLDVSYGIVFADSDIINVKIAFEELKKFKPLIIENSMPTVSKHEERLKLNLENHFEIMEILFNTMPYVFWKDRNGRYLGCNLNQVKAFHFDSVPDFIGKTVFDLLPDPESARIVDETDTAIMNNGKMVILEETLTTPEGIKTYLSQKQPLYDNEGIVIGMLGFSMDITKTKEQEKLAKEQSEKLEREKHQLEIDNYKQLAEQQEKFTKLANQVAHDIRSPLASLLMIVKACTQIPESERIALREAAAGIGDIANHLLNQYKKKEIDDVEMEEPKLLLVSTVLLELLTAKKYQYKKLPIKFNCHFEEHTQFSFIKAQFSAFKRMVSNLINNAVDALEETAGTINLNLAADSECVKITLQDTGKGMPPQLIAKIRDKVSITEGKKEGHGIGLAQVWETLDKNQGEMHIDSIVGKGSRFILTFPRTNAPHWIVEEIVLSPNDTVIILDDDISIHGAWRARFETILYKNPGIKIKHFEEGREAVEFMNALSPIEKEKVLLLSDYELLRQELNGLHIIAKSEVKRSILVTSHYADSLVQEQAAKTGTKILPKQLASEIPIKIIEIEAEEPITLNSVSNKVDAILIDDDERFSDQLVFYVFENKIVDQYLNPEHFLKNAHRYPKDTKIYLDNNYANSWLKGVDVARELHEQGYERLYLLSGDTFQKGELPDYLTVIRKDDIEGIQNS